MKSHYLILAVIGIFVVFFGLQTIGGEIRSEIEYNGSPNDSIIVADLIPYEISLVWTNNTNNQIIDFVAGNFDSDAQEEVAVVTQNGTLYLFDNDGSRIWYKDIESTPYAISKIAADADSKLELLIGTQDGFLVVAANETILTNITLSDEARAVSAAYRHPLSL